MLVEHVHDAQEAVIVRQRRGTILKLEYMEADDMSRKNNSYGNCQK